MNFPQIVQPSPPPRDAPNNAAACGLAAIEQTPTPRLRYFRITFSVVPLLLCILLLVFWVRSYTNPSTMEFWTTPTHRHFLLSMGGELIVNRELRLFAGVEFIRSDWGFAGMPTYAGLGMIRYDDGQSLAISLPYWLLVAASFATGLVPWLPWRFSLRTLLITTTLAAIALGFIIATIR